MATVTGIGEARGLIEAAKAAERQRARDPGRAIEWARTAAKLRQEARVALRSHGFETAFKGAKP